MVCISYGLLCIFLQFLFVSCEVDISYWLRQSENKIYSQNGEDGIIGALIDVIEYATSSSSIPKTFVEFGVEDGKECNTRLLRETRQFHGWLMDGSHENIDINLSKHYITAENINQILTSLKVPKGPNTLGILSIDLDRNDWYVWKSILEANQYRPVMVIIEYNSSIDPDEALVVPYEPSTKWDGTHFYGASLRALTILGEQYGYALVACDSTGTNAFFIDTKWEAFHYLKRGGFGSLLLPSISSAYIRANYLGEQPPSTSQEHDARLSIPVMVGDTLQHLNCPLLYTTIPSSESSIDILDISNTTGLELSNVINEKNSNIMDKIDSCSKEFVKRNNIESSCIDCVIKSLKESLSNRRWLHVKG